MPMSDMNLKKWASKRAEGGLFGKMDEIARKREKAARGRQSEGAKAPASKSFMAKTTTSRDKEVKSKGYGEFAGTKPVGRNPTERPSGMHPTLFAEGQSTRAQRTEDHRVSGDSSQAHKDAAKAHREAAEHNKKELSAGRVEKGYAEKTIQKHESMASKHESAASAGGWDDAKHPRDESGKFT